MTTSTTQETVKSIPTPQQIAREFPQLRPLLPEGGQEWYAGRGNPLVHLINQWLWHQEAILALFRKTVDDPDPDTAWGAYHALRNHTALMQAIKGVAQKYSSCNGAEPETPNGLEDPERAAGIA